LSNIFHQTFSQYGYHKDFNDKKKYKIKNIYACVIPRVGDWGLRIRIRAVR